MNACAHRCRGGQHLEVIAAVVVEDIAHRTAIKNRLQRLTKTIDIRTQIGGAAAVNLDEQLRLGGFIAQLDAAKAAVIHHPLELGWIAKARTPMTPCIMLFNWTTILCWLRPRSP